MLGYAFAGLLAAQFGLVLADQLPALVGQHLFALCTGLSCVGLAVRLLRGGQRLLPAEQLLTPARPRARRAASSAARLIALLPHSATALGALTAMLPCGALLSALVLATGTGAGESGAAVMAGFALASGPALVASSFLARHLARLRNPRLRLAAAISLLIAAIVIAAPKPAHSTPSHDLSERPSCH